MRIAQLVTSYEPRLGGVETHVGRLARGCADAGDKVTVLTHRVAGAPGEERAGGVRILRFPLTVASANYPLSLPLFRYLDAHRADFDLVHAHSYHTLVAHAAVNSRLPFVFTPHYHGTGHTPFRALLHHVYRPAGARSFRAAAAVICVSDAERALVAGDFPAVASKAITIPNGTDVRLPAATDGQFSGAPVPAGAARAAAPVVLAIGRLERYKNVDLIIDAFRALPGEARLVVVGDGPDRARLERHAAGDGWPVCFTGRVPDHAVGEWLARATVVTSASDHEAFGMIVAEGLAGGAQVVASAIPAHAELARRAGPGAPVTLIDPRLPGDFTAALAAALAAGRVPPGAVRLPSWPDVVERTREVYARARETT